MEENFDLAGAVAIILGLHSAELNISESAESRITENSGPSLRAAQKIWQELHLATVGSLQMTERMRALAESPSEATRHALEDDLRPLLEADPALSARIEEAITLSPYASLRGRTPSPSLTALSRLTQSKRNKLLVQFSLIVGALLILTNGSIALEKPWVILIVLAVKGMVTGYFAAHLDIKRPIWLGIGAAVPGNILLILGAMSGYRLEDGAEGGSTVHYTGATRAWAAGILMFPIALAIPLAIVNPDYMGLLVEYAVGRTLLAAAAAAIGIAGLVLWLGYWRERAKTGIGIALVSTLAGWLTTFVLWVILLGPAAVRISTW